MPKRIVIGIIFMFGLLWAEESYLKLYLQDYNPIINNRVEVYKLDKGLNIYRNTPYQIAAFAPEYDEEINFENQSVLLTTKIGEFPIAPAVPLSFDDYFDNVVKKSFRKSLISNVKTQAATTQVASSGVFGEWKLDIPAIAIPKAVQKVLGKKPGILNLDGTQKISIEGSSTKRKQIPIYETEANSRFDLKMRQDTNLRLSGTIGEKITVNFKYNSNQDEQIFDANNINLKYTGTEDEIVQSIEGGNITLSLSGSRYISYSTSSQGLFGITSKFKYGDLDLNIIASKEEGEKNTQTYLGQSQADSTVVRSKDYTSRTMFYLWNPYELYQLYGSGDGGIPEGWRNNAIRTAPNGSWLINNSDLLPANGTVRLYYDDGNGNNNNTATPGDTIFFSPTNFYVPHYEEMIEGTDFVTDYSSGIVTITRNIDRLYTLAVKYSRRDEANTPVPQLQPGEADDGLLHVHVIRRRNQSYQPYDPADQGNVWHYQMRNVYNMYKTNIKNEGFSLQVYTLNADLTRNFNIPDSLATPGYITYTDYLRLDSNGDGLINGDDNTVNLASGLVVMPYLEPFKPLGDGVIYEDENEMINYLDIKFYISIKGKIGRDAIELAQGGILKGSVRVKVNGTEQRENVDYIVDYDFGRITFLSAAGKDPDARIEIDFEYRSMFAVARKSLAGIRAEYSLSDATKLGGTLIYRSESVADKRPRIGNENIEMLMGDIDGSVTVKPAFITRWLDAMPLINTTAESQISLSGEVAVTIPRIYGDPDGKKKEAFIDDMESIMDSYPLGVTFSSWVQGSKPFGTGLVKGRVNWYNPKNIPREQVEEASTLTEEERKENVTVLAMKVFPNNLNFPKDPKPLHSYAGIMKYLGNQLDFSQKKYIEVMLKMETASGDPYPNATMHIDLGDISEDFYIENGGYGILNSEDADRDGVLTLEEDIGLDNKTHGSPGADPNDLADNDQDQYGDYPQINGTEGNRLLDTEDLDNNGVLSKLDRYFSYAFSISDSSSSLIQSSNNYGWRMYRIPLTDPEYYQIVNNSGTTIQPTLKKVSYARIWVDTDSKARVLMSDISVVGNKWQDFYIRDFANNSIIPTAQIQANNTSYLSGIVGNQKNRSHYTPPPRTVYMDGDRESSESSLSLNINNLPSDQQCLLRQRMLDSYSLLSYDKLKFWVYPEAAQDLEAQIDSLDVIFRIGADSLNYYQVRQRVPVVPYSLNPSNKMEANRWVELDYNLQEMIALKELNPGSYSDSLSTEDRVYYLRGNPTLTNIRDIYLGVYNPYDLDNDRFSGTVYFNEMRVLNPYQEIGIAKRVSLNSNFADFSTLTVDYEDKSENFNPTIQRGRANTFTRTQNFNVTNKYFLNKFFPNSWNLDLPLSLTRNYTLGIPRFQANSDLLRNNLTDPVEKDRQKNESLLYSADLAISQKVAPKSKILQYTLFRTSISARVEDSYRYTPTSVDTVLTYRGTLNYNLNIPSESTSIVLFKNYKLGLFPSTFGNTFTYNGSEPRSFNWEKREEQWNWHERAQTTDSKLFTTDNNISWTLLSDLTATGRWNTKRDLMQRKYYKDFNIGKLTEFVQDLGVNYNPSLFPRIFNVTSAITARYSDTQRKFTQLIEGEQVNVYERDGNSNRGIRMNLTLQNSNLLSGWVSSWKSKIPSSPNDEIKEPSGDYKNEDEKYKQEQEYIRMMEEQKKEAEKLLNEEKEKLEKERLEKEEKERLEKEEQERLDKELTEEDKMSGELDPEIKEGDPDAKPEELLSDEKEKEDSTKTEIAPPKPKKPRINPLLVTMVMISKIKNITASYQNSYVQNYANQSDPYPFTFQIGLPHSVPRDSLEAITNDNTITIGSGVAISRKLDTVINYSFTDNRRYASASNQSIGYTFPDVTVSLMDFESFLGLGKFLSSTRLNSGFQYSVRQTGDVNWIKPKQETYTTAMNPLLGFTGNILKVVSANLNFSMSQTENVTDMDTYDIVKTSDTHGVNGNFSYSYRAGKGFTIPFTKRRIHIKNELSTSLGLVWEKSYDVTKGRESTQVDRNTTRLAITPGASYQFDTNIRGGLTSSYENTTDAKRDDGTRIFSLGIWVEVNL